MPLTTPPLLAAENHNLFTESPTENTFLSPDEAFKLEVTANGTQSLNAQFTIAPGHYLYKARIKFEVKDPAQGSITRIELPESDIKNDPNFGKMEVYHHDFASKIILANTTKFVNLAATFQGCSEKGLCYAPMHKTFEVTLNTTSINSNDDQATVLLKGRNLWLIIAGFFGFGLLLALTPCVLPMIPILSGIIVGDEKAHHHATSRLHSFNLSLAYVLGMALSYTLAGIAAGLSGKLISSALQNPWVLGATALIFVGLAFSMFGFYELRLPSRIENSMVNTTNRLKGGQFIGVFVMGILSALIVSPCVAAPLAGALLYISQTHDVVLGGIALFALSIGMGVPLLLIGASAGHVLPKAGTWMTAVRHFFGVLMLAVAIYIISPALPLNIVMMLWAALLIIPAIYLHALDSLPINTTTGKSHPWMRFWKGIGIIMLVLGIAELIGAVSGAPAPTQPLAGFGNPYSNTSSPNATNTIATLPFKRINNNAELDAEIKNSPNKIVMLDFYANWCVACKEMYKFTFSNEKVQTALKDVVLLQADVSNNSADDIALLKRFQLFGPPGIIFFNKMGHEINAFKVIGYKEADTFLNTIHQVNSLKPDECNPVITC